MKDLSWKALIYFKKPAFCSQNETSSGESNFFLVDRYVRNFVITFSAIYNNEIL